jgi:RNA polymerase sigma-70 factor (ECF subfamily)
LDQHRDGTGDLDLVRKARSGLPEAIEAFVQRMRCIPRFLAARNQRFGRPLSAEDLADASQQVFGLVWSKSDEYRGAASLETWVYPFCSLTFANVTRRGGKRAVPLDGAGPEPAAPSAARGPGEVLDDEVLFAALGRIDPLSARVIELKQFEDLTFDEIAERLAIPANTVKSRYYRGLADLRDRLRSLDPEDAR